ncbi:MAG: TetR/AcrR family transcriptional regulator, partial [Burkholderiaceae bacterium]|nr:TetR/AcrR family transcriptional regulator [Burkholderiaceae bacterium]
MGRFEEVLLQKSRDSRLGKRMRTRFLFLTIVAQCIQIDSAKDPTLEDVLERSGLARSTFYTNFKDVAECVTEVLTLFFESLGESRGITERELSSYQAILEANTWYCRSYEANAGLFAGVARNPTVLKMREAQNASWARKIVHVSERRRGVPFTQAIRKEYTGIVGI